MKRLVECIFVLAAIAWATHAGAYSISLTPTSDQIARGGTSTLAIVMTLDESEELEAFNLSLKFDPTIVRLLSFTSPSIPSTPVNAGQAILGFFHNYEGGYVHFPGVMKNILLKGENPDDDLEDSFTLASLTFAGVDFGTSSLSLTGHLKIEEEDRNIMFRVREAAELTVAPVPEPQGLVLMALGVAALWLSRRKRVVKG